MSSGSVQDGEMKTLMKLEDLVSIDQLADFLSGTQAVAFSCTQRQGRLLPVDTGNAGQIQLSDFAAAGQRHRHSLPIARSR